MHLSAWFSAKLQADVLQAPFKFIHIQDSITVTWTEEPCNERQLELSRFFECCDFFSPTVGSKLLSAPWHCSNGVNHKNISNTTNKTFICPLLQLRGKNPSKTWSTRSIISLTSCKERITFRFRGRKAFKQSSSCTCTRPVLSSKKTSTTTKRRETVTKH